MESRKLTEEEIEKCKKILEERGYLDTLDLDISDYGEPDNVIVISDDDVLKGEI